MRKQNLVTRQSFVERLETSDKSYSGDNRLVWSESSYRRPSSAPRCRLILAPRWRRWEAYGCSPFKRIRELGSNRQKIEPNIDINIESYQTAALSRKAKWKKINSYRWSPKYRETWILG